MMMKALFILTLILTVALGSLTGVAAESMVLSDNQDKTSENNYNWEVAKDVVKENAKENTKEKITDEDRTIASKKEPSTEKQLLNETGKKLDELYESTK